MSAPIQVVNSQNRSLLQSATSGAFWLTIEMGGVQIISLMVFSMIAHYLTPADFGIISVSYVFVYSVKYIMFDNIASYVIRADIDSDSHYSTAFWVSTITGVVLTLCIIGLSGFITKSFGIVGSLHVIRAMSIIVFFMGLGRTHEAWMTRHFRFRALAFRSTGGAISGGIVGVMLAVSGYGVYALVAQQVIMSFVSLLLMWYSTPWRPSLRCSYQSFLELLRLLKVLVPNGIVTTAIQNADLVMITYFFGIEATGFYSIARRLRFALSIVANTPISGVSLPALSECKNEIDRLKATFLKGLTLLSVFSVPVFAGASAISLPVINLMFGQKWAPSSPIFSILALAGVPAMLVAYFDSLLLVLDRPQWSLASSCILLIGSIATFLIIPKSGLTLVALPFALPYIITLPIAILVGCRALDLSLRAVAEAIGPAIVASLAMYLVAVAAAHFGMHSSMFAQIVGSVLAGACTYVFILAMLGRGQINLILRVFQIMLLKNRR